MQVGAPICLALPLFRAIAVLLADSLRFIVQGKEVIPTPLVGKKLCGAFDLLSYNRDHCM